MFRGPLLMLGYWGNEAKTRGAIEADGWMHTGDLGSMDADGSIYIVDRLKDLIITCGFNVYPAEIERVLAAHPSVALSAVGRLPDPVKGEIAKAYVILKEGAKADAEALMAHCRAYLAAYKLPRKIQFVSDLPRTRAQAKSCGVSSQRSTMNSRRWRADFFARRKVWHPQGWRA